MSLAGVIMKHKQHTCRVLDMVIAKCFVIIIIVIAVVVSSGRHDLLQWSQGLWDS